MISIEKLRAVKPHCERMASCFTWTVRTARENKYRFDPPCASLVGRMGPFRIEICADGEWFAWFLDKEVSYGGERWGKIDGAARPMAIAMHVIRSIQEDVE